MSLPNLYETQTRLCDDDGMVSHEKVDPPKLIQPDMTYLQQINNLRANTAPLGEHKPVKEPFTCTGSAHLAGAHIKCTSPAHIPGIKLDEVYRDPFMVNYRVIGRYADKLWVKIEYPLTQAEGPEDPYRTVSYDFIGNLDMQRLPKCKPTLE